MTQYDFGIIDPTIVDGTELASMLNDWRDALYTMQRGSTRPSFVVPGQLWCNDAAGPSSWVVNVYMSPTIGDVPLFTINTTLGTITMNAAQTGGPFLPLAGGSVVGPVDFQDPTTINDQLWSDFVSGQPIHIFRAQANSANARIFTLVENADGTFSIRALSDDQTTLQGEAKINRDGSMLATSPAGGAMAGEVVTAAWVRALFSSLVPTGQVVSFAGTAAPAGWLLCAGQLVSRSTYAALFGVIGSTFGAGDGSTTFAVPDLRGRAVFGADAMGGIAANRLGGAGAAAGGIVTANIGQSGGEQAHTLVTAESPVLSGSFNVNFGDSYEGYYPLLDGNTPAGTTGWGLLAITAGYEPMQMQISGGGGGKHNTTPPALVLDYIIKT
jgi:microcystin-dependent protein